MHPSKLQAIQTALAQLGLAQRLDALDTAYLARELESVEQTIYQTEYPELKARMLIPVDTSDPPGARSISYDMFDRFGIAKIISNFADDLPMADAFKKRTSSSVHSMGIGYQYTIEDMLAAAAARAIGRAGADILQEKATGAREGSEAKLDDIAFFGDADAGLGGFANNSNVTVTSEITGTWSTATAAQIMADLDELVSAHVTQMKGRVAPKSLTVVLPLASYLIVAHKPVDTTNQDRVLKVWLEHQPFVGDVFWSEKLDTADAAGTGPRMVCYRREPRVLALKIPMDYTTLPPQAKNLAFVVPAIMRVGGTVMRYPVNVTYMDNI